MAEKYGEGYFLRGEGSNYGRDKFAPYIRRFFMPHALQRAIQIQENINPKSVLDVGCARGYLVFALRSLGIEAYGIDVSEWAIKNCEKNTEKYLVRGDASKLPYKDSSFDLVVAEDLLEHVSPQPHIKEMCRVAKNRIFIRVTVVDNGVDTTHISVLPAEKWTAMFRRCGWKSVKELLENQVDGNSVTTLEFIPRKTPVNKKLKYVVLIPVFNAESTLALCLEYIRRLRPKPEKVIFCENNSDDDTLNIICDYKGAKELIRFTLAKDVFVKGNHLHTGIAMARQKLLQAARMMDIDYAVYVDADILVLNKDLIKLIHRRELDVLAAPYYRHFPNGVYLASLWAGEKKEEYQMKGATVQDLEFPLVTSAGLLALSKKALQDNNLNFHPIHLGLGKLTAEDFGFCTLARVLGYQIYLDTAIKVHHLIRESIKPKPWAIGEDDKPINFLYP